MKFFNLGLIVLVFALVISFGEIALAQDNQGNVVVINNAERSFSGTGSMAEFDSLTVEYNKWCRDKNEYIVSYKVVRHWWGNDNRDFVTIVEVKNWDDILKFNEREDELFREHWNTKEMRKAFNDAYNKYFSGKHSDEIYQEVVFND
jgi:hypothetical protein